MRLFGKSGQWWKKAQRRGSRAYRQRNGLSFRGGFLERLEDRRLLAITVDFTLGVLTFTGDASNDTLIISANDSTSSNVSFTSPTDPTVATQSPKSGVTAIFVNLGGNTNDTLTINGSNDADTISINGTIVTFVSSLVVDVSYTLTDVENLFVNAQLNNDTVTATGASVSGHLSFSGGDGTDALSITGPLQVGSLTVEDPEPDDVELSGLGGSAGITTTADQVYNVPVTLVGNTELTGNDISFNSTVNSFGANRTLDVITSGGGTTIFGGTVGGTLALASLTTNSDGTTAINGGLVRTTGDQIYGDAVTLNSPAGSPTFNLTSLTSTAGSVRFDSTLNSLQLNEEDLAINTAVETIFNGAVGTAANGALSSLIINGAGTTRINGGAVMTTAGQFYSQAVTLNALGNATTLTSTMANVQFNSTLNSLLLSEENLSIDAAVETIFNGAVGTAVGGALNSLTTNSNTANGAGTTRISGGTVTTNNDQTYNEAVTLGANTILNGNDISFNSTLDSVGANRSLQVNTFGGAATTFGGAVGVGFELASLTTNADGATRINAGVVNTTGDQIYNDLVSVGADSTLTASSGNITFNVFVDAADNGVATTSSFGLTVNTPNLTSAAGKGHNFFNSVVGGGNFGGDPDGLKFLTTDATTAFGRTELNGGAVTTTVDQTYHDAVTLNAAANATTLSSTTGSVTFNGTLDSFQLNEEDLTIVAGNDVALNATVGGMVGGRLDDLDVTAGNDVRIAEVHVTNTVDLTATAGAITHDGDAAADVLSTRLVAQAGGGIDLDTTIERLTVTSAGGMVDIDESNNLIVESITAAIQTVDLSAGGTISDDADAAVDITASSLFLLATGGIELQTTIAELTATNNTNGDIDIDETDAVQVNGISAFGQTVELSAGGAITQDGDAAPDIGAASLILQATGGINLDTSVDNFTANNDASGDIVIDEAFGINVLSATNDGGNIQIVAAGGAMNITTADSAGFFVGSTSDTAAADNLVVSGHVAAQSFVSLIAGDDVTLLASSDVSSAGSFVYMKVDASSVDAAGGTLILLGALQGDNSLQYPLVAEGDAGDDLFSIQSLPQSAMAILGRGGSLDNTFIVLTDAAEDVRVFATIVDLAGQSPGGVNPIEITYVDNEQLDLVTLGGDDKIFVQMPEPAHGVLANIIRMTTGAGEDSLKINGSTLSDVIRVNSYTNDGRYRFQVRGDTGETECLQVFGFLGNDIIENAAPIAALLDGGNGQDAITGSDFSIHPVTGAEIYDVIFGGGDADSIFDPVTGRAGLSGRAGNDFLYADHDYNLGAPVLTFADGDIVNGGPGRDVIIALGGDSIQRDSGDFESDVVVGQGLGLSVNDFLFAQLVSPSAANINQQLQAGLNKHCAMPIP